MAHRENQEILKEYQSKLGEEFGALFHGLIAQYVQICGLWDNYKILYGHSEERYDFVTQASPSFFGYVESTFFEQTIISICRINDPIRINKRYNLTVKRLIEHVENAIKPELQKLLDELDISCKFAKDWRNRYIAHNDIERITGNGAPLAPASRIKIDKCINDIYNILKFITEKLLNSSLGKGVIQSDTAKGVLYILYDGIERKNSIREKLLSGELERSPQYPPYVTE